MRDPAIYTQDRQTYKRARRTPQGNTDTNVTCGCLLLLLFLAVVLASHGYAYQQSVRTFVAIFGSA